jgi:hypothetical protein
VSMEISQISNAPGMDDDAYFSSDIWWNNGNRCLYFLYSGFPGKNLVLAYTTAHTLLCYLPLCY